MKKHFYHHLIEIEPLQIILDGLVITDKERNELMTIVESTTHYVVTDIILTELSDINKKKFLSHVAHNEHDKIWDLLTKNIIDVEFKIRVAIADTHLSMIDDVKKITKQDSKRSK